MTRFDVAGARALVAATAERLSQLERSTRPVDPDVAEALERRWSELPASARTSAQLLGRRGAGCEGTHGVFPRCNLRCRPCYHSPDANRVRTDGPHTLAAIDEQMGYAAAVRGPVQYAQLIGGEVSLLDPDDHAAALAIMRRHGRVPMSFTHGDFDYDYLRRVVLDAEGSPRFEHVAFAVHIDSTMRGRRSMARPRAESDLQHERARVAEMFDRLEREHGVGYYLAHTMTVTPENIDEVPDVIRTSRSMGYRMFSFQPAAYVGDERRWSDGFREVGMDELWARIERGAGSQLPHEGIHFGDPRCNRVCWGAYVGGRYVPLLDDRDPRDLAARDAFLDAFPGSLGDGRPALRLSRVARSVARRPRVIPAVAGWARRFVARAGGLRAGWSSVQPTTFVVHRFMDTADVANAWEHIVGGTAPTQPHLVETFERLAACAYSMAHPELGRMVPACVQHSVLDPAENAQLVDLLPRPASRVR